MTAPSGLPPDERWPTGSRRSGGKRKGSSPSAFSGAKRRDRFLLLRRAVQYGALAAFLALIVAARRGGWPPAIVHAPLRLDPLATLAYLFASHTLPAGSALALITLVLTLALGRAWCGWLCPLGTVLDLFTLRPRTAEAPRRDSLRQAKHILWLTVLAAALLGNLTLLVLDPLTLLIRSVAVALWPALEQLVTAAEQATYALPPLRPAVEWVDGILRPAVFPVEAPFYRVPLLYALVLVAVIALNGIAPRFWCRYLCPLGGLLGWIGKVALVRRQVTASCTRCGLCASACPTGTIRPDRAYASDPTECTMCLECHAVCPADALRFPTHRRPAPRETYDPGRREALAALGVGILGVGLLRSDRSMGQGHPHRIRPPGAQGDDFEAKCIRCGLCARACPTGAIQPALTEAGAAGFWTPVLTPRLGYCDYSCNTCGQVCPVQAIPPLDLEEKRRTVIGRAYIDRNRCIPWTDNRPCIVCEEMCPVPKKAIILEEVQVTGPDGLSRILKRPHAVAERCIGCGICEYKCPVSRKAAIQVYATE